MTKKESTLKDKGFITGLILIVISFIIHLLLSKNAGFATMNRDLEGMYYVNFLIACLYFVITFIMGFRNHRFKFSKYNHRYFICSLILMSISCFTINIPFPVFANFSLWVDVYLILMHGSLIALCFDEALPRIAKAINYFVLGLGLMMSLYFTIFLSPFVPISIIGIIFFGLTFHLLVPLIMTITIIYQFYKRSKSKLDKMSFVVGIILPLFIIGIYVVKWNNAKKIVHTANASIITRPENTLPTWVLLSQKLSDDFFTRRILKGSIGYETSIFGNPDFIGTSRNSFNESIEHDPLVIIGSELIGNVGISKKDRIKILSSQFDLRHKSKRKLWSGKHLTTSNVLTNTQVFPDYRLAYSEKIISIKNNYLRRNWNRQEEALYTFHMPEGSVATSLSLWIDGIEEKSRLTTKSKADSAYTKIVGVERRDPSIMHWQEGNTITVYVFPCTPEEERMFKIGITTPLAMRDNKLILPNVYFEGPDFDGAMETNIIEFKSNQNINADLPSSFDEILPNKFQYTGNYLPYWEANCDITDLSNHTFSFNGNSYTMEESPNNMVEFKAEKLFLDVNSSWTKKEFDDVLSFNNDKEIYVFYDQLIQLNNDNQDQYFYLLSDLNFSLFPLNKITDPKTTLLISKSSNFSPTLDDLKKSKFISGVKKYLKDYKDKINHYSLSPALSPYLKSLKEFQVFNYATGDMDGLKEMIENDKFFLDHEGINEVRIGLSNTLIKKSIGDSTSKAPDHLMRLFAYNKIMKDCGRNYFTGQDYIEEKLIGIANEAFVVSPISSLIVLETQKDYDRFGIEKNKNSLKNASTNSSGAVPEPHEWAMIILLASILIFIYYKRKYHPVIS